MINTILLDMDGVITDFVGGVCKAFNKANPYPEETRDYSFWHAWPDISFDDVNAICNQEFWHNLEWMYDGRETLRAIMGTLGLESVYLATYPMPNIESPTGKWLWVQDNLPVYLKRTIITQAPKTLLVQPDALIIDDKDENVEEFVVAGGQGILVPRHWNRAHKQADNSANVVREQLEKLC